MTKEMLTCALLGGDSSKSAKVARGRLSLGKRWSSGKYPLFLRVALFFAEIKKQRDALLWATSKRRTAPSGGHG